MVLIDTSSWIEALRKDGDPAARVEVAKLIASGEARLCDLVRLELWNGAHGAAERKGLRAIEAAVASLPIDRETWAGSLELARRARARGVTAPATDVLIAACARRHGSGLYHRDGHIAALLGS